MTTVIVAEEVKQVKTKITKMQEAVATVDITDTIAVKIMAGNIKKMLDFLTGKRDALIEPAKAIVVEAKATYDPYIDACKMAKVGLTNRATAHVVEQQRLAKIEEDKIAAEAQKKKDKIEQDVAAGKISEEKASEKLQTVDEKATDKMGEVSEVSKTHGGINVRMIKKVTFIDPASLPEKDIYFLIKNGYLVWDEVKARKDALSGLGLVGTIINEVPNGALTGK